MKTIISAGRIVTATDDYVADILIEDDTIAAIGRALDSDADLVLDATDCYVLPGCVDPHTHFDLPFAGTVTRDDFTSGSISAVFGGTTCHIDFAIQEAGQSYAEAVDTWIAKTEASPPVIDFGLHLGITDLQGGGALSDLAQIVERGISSFKLFMAYKDTIMVRDDAILEVMQAAAELGGVVMVHAENGDAIDLLVRQAKQAGHTEPIWHALTRPPETEGEATYRAIQLAHLAGCPLYVVHVSCDDAVVPIARARASGWNIWGETCTHFLVIDEDYLRRPDFEGAKYVYTPPARSKHHLQRLWAALENNELSVVATDHAPFSFADQKAVGRHDFSQIPPGPCGVEERLKLIHELGVRSGRISLNRMVELLSTNPARLFGLFPRKGTVAVGSDADLVIFDPDRQETLSVDRHHSRCDYNMYEGTEIVGAPRTVLVRGRVVVDDGELQVEPGWGRFVPRSGFLETLSPRAVQTKG